MQPTCLVLLVFAICLCSIALLIGICICRKSITHVYKSDIMLPLFKNLYLSSTLAYFFYIICLSISLAFINRHTALYNYIGHLATFAYYCLMLPLLMITFTARLHNTFQGTFYHVNKYFMFMIYFVIAIIIALNFAFALLSIYSQTISTSHINLHLIFRGLLLISFILYVVFSYALMVVFVSKLKQLIIKQTNFHGRSIMTCTQKEISIELSLHQTLLISQATKNIVLSLFVFGSTALVAILTFIEESLPIDLFLAISIFRMMTLVDAICNFICMYLQFAFASDDYRSVCRVCNHFVRKQFTTDTKVSIKKKRMSMEMDTELSIINHTRIVAHPLSSMSSSRSIEFNTPEVKIIDVLIQIPEETLL